MTAIARSIRIHPLIRRFKDSSLRWQILFLLLAISVAMSLLISIGVYHFISANERATWQARQREAAGYAGKVVGDFAIRLQDYLLLVSSLDRATLRQNPDLLEHYLMQNQAVLEVVRTDENGRLLAGATRAAPLLSNLFTLPQSQWFAQAKSGRTYMGGLQVSSNDEPYLIASVPAGDGGGVAARVDMNILWDVIKQIRFGETGHAYVITADGSIIAHHDSRVVLAYTTLQGRPGLMDVATNLGAWSGTYTNFAGESVQSVSQAIPNTDWFIVAELPTSEAEATSRQALLIFLVGIGMFGASVMWFIYSALRRLVVVPLEQMRSGAARIGAGDLNHRIRLVQRDEIGQLAAGFDDMVTQLEKRNDELARKTMELATEVEEHRKTQAELRLLNAELSRSNRELQEFAYLASHDLQEPLRKVRAFGDRLAEKYTDALDERGRDYIRRMQSSAERMQALIDALLTYSRVTTKAQPFTPTDLSRVALETASDFDLRLQETKGNILVGELATINADPLQMRLLFQNLMSNALKFQLPDSRPKVVIEGSWVRGQSQNGGASLDGDAFEFTVCDNGIGFEPEFAERIFQVFQRLHGRSEYEGTGVGLAICRKIVDRHGGTIVATGTPGKGAIFTITLPKCRQTLDQKDE